MKAGTEEGTLKFGFGGEFNGAPTSISQRWFGSPCGGFKPTVVAGVAAWPGAVAAGAFTAGAVVVVVVPLLSPSEQLNMPKNKAATAICDAIFMMSVLLCG